MITDVVIENFKKFKKLKLNGLKRLVLVSGRNNIGKSSVLEALFLYMNHASADSFGKLNSFRGVSVGGPEGLWEPLFFQRDTLLPIRMELTSDGVVGRLEYRRDDNYLPAEVNGVSEDVIAQFRTVTKETYSLGCSYECGDYSEKAHFSLSATSILREIKTSMPGNEIIPGTPTHFKNSIYMRDYNLLINSVGKMELAGDKRKLIDMLKILDPSVEDIVTISVKGTTQLYLKTDGILMPLQYSGDGIVKMLNICMAIMEHRNGLLLIDELENGLHYSMYTKLWTLIDSITSELNCQVIATTHSYELIAALLTRIDDMNDLVFYRLGRRNNNVEAFRFDSKMLTLAFQEEMEIR